MAKATRVTVIGNGFNISANDYPSVYMDGTKEVVFIGSNQVMLMLLVHFKNKTYHIVCFNLSLVIHGWAIRGLL